MNVRSILRFAAICMMCASLFCQSTISLLVGYDFLMTGRVGFVSAFSYGAILPFSMSSFLLAAGLACLANIRLPRKRFLLPYVGSHLLIIVLALLFPGKFGV